jgi:hypothetical protein
MSVNNVKLMTGQARLNKERQAQEEANASTALVRTVLDALENDCFVLLRILYKGNLQHRKSRAHVMNE